MEQNEAFMTSPIGDLPINSEGLRKAVDEITRLRRAEAELQELNMKYYNEAKDNRKETARLQEENKNLKEALENDFTYETTNGGKMNVLTMIRQQAVKEFAEKLKDKFNGYEATSYNGCEEGWHDLQEEISELAREYGVEL